MLVWSISKFQPFCILSFLVVCGQPQGEEGDSWETWPSHVSGPVPQGHIDGCGKVSSESIYLLPLAKSHEDPSVVLSLFCKHTHRQPFHYRLRSERLELTGLFLTILAYLVVNKLPPHDFPFQLFKGINKNLDSFSAWTQSPKFEGIVLITDSTSVQFHFPGRGYRNAKSSKTITVSSKKKISGKRKPRAVPIPLM